MPRDENMSTIREELYRQTTEMPLSPKVLQHLTVRERAQKVTFLSSLGPCTIVTLFCKHMQWCLWVFKREMYETSATHYLPELPGKSE